ncbi:MAG: hypothetical protein H0X51_04210, partial [Parachlamydiaceae bacterium]|nr:hypothetical protein [Parachlamydiaceae bacterium]
MTSTSSVSHTSGTPIELTKEQLEALKSLPTLETITESILEQSPASFTHAQAEIQARETYQRMRQRALINVEAPQRIAAVKWPVSYAPLLIKEALILNVMQVMQILEKACPNSTLPTDVNGLFIYFIEKLNKRPFHFKNEEMFASFQKKLFSFCDKANIKGPVLNAVKALKLLQKVAAVPDLETKNLSDYPEALSKDTSSPDVNKTLVSALYAFNASVVRYTEVTFQEILSPEQFKTLLSTDPIPQQTAFLEQYKQLRTIFHARKNLLLQRLKDIQQQVDKEKPTLILPYLCAEHQNDTKLLFDHLIKLQKFLTTALERNPHLFSAKKFEAMKLEERLYLLDNEHDHIDAALENAKSKHKELHEFDEIQNLDAETVALIKKQAQTNIHEARVTYAKALYQERVKAHRQADLEAEAAGKESKSNKFVLQVMKEHVDKMEMFRDQHKMLDQLGDIRVFKDAIQKIEQLIPPLLADKRASVLQKKQQQLTPKELRFNEKTLEDRQRILYRVMYKLETCEFGLSTLHTHFSNMFPRLFPTVQTFADLEVLWTQFYDELCSGVHTEAEAKAEAETKADVAEGERKVAAAHTTDGEAAEAPSSSVEAPATAMMMQVATKALKLQPMTLNTVVRSFTIQPAEAVRSQLSLKDAGYHWTLFMQNVAMLRDCLATNQQFQPAFVMAFTRHGATMSEQDLAAEAGTFLHSQVQLAKKVALMSQLPEGETKEIGSFVADVDQGTLSHRYPTSMLRMYQSRRQTPPQTLQWLLKPDSCTPKDFIAFITSSIKYMENRHVGPKAEPDHTLSEQWAKALTAALTTKEPAKEPSKYLRQNLKKAFSAISQITAQVEVARKVAHSHEDDSLVSTYSEVLFHLTGLQSELSRWIALPQTSYLAANGDLIWTHLQALDEQIGTALSGTRTHNLEKLRELVGRTETLEHTQVVTNINID